MRDFREWNWQESETMLWKPAAETWQINLPQRKQIITDSWVMRIKQKYTHLLLKNPKEREKEKKSDRKEVFKITFQISQKGRCYCIMHCSAYYTVCINIIPFLKIK